jgi:hypothetical protein
VIIIIAKPSAPCDHFGLNQKLGSSRKKSLQEH